MKKFSFLFGVVLIATALLTSCGKKCDKNDPKSDCYEPKPTAVIVINEAYSRGGSLASDGTNYGDYDWVELYNNSDVEGDLGDFMLYDKEDKSEFVILPKGTKIAPHGFLVVEVDVEGGFGLSRDGDQVYLENAEGIMIDHIVFGSLTPDQAYARNPDGSETFGIQKPTRGATNNTQTPIQIGDYTGLIINEVDGNGKFVELYNNSSNPISLEGVMLIKDESSTWWIGGDISIAAHGFYTIAQSGGASGANEYTGASGISTKKIVKFELKSPYGALIIDFFARTLEGRNFGDNCTPDYAGPPSYSFSRCPNGTGEFGLATPSCNSANPAIAAGAIVTN